MHGAAWDGRRPLVLQSWLPIPLHLAASGLQFSARSAVDVSGGKVRDTMGRILHCCVQMQVQAEVAGSFVADALTCCILRAQGKLNPLMGLNIQQLPAGELDSLARSHEQGLRRVRELQVPILHLFEPLRRTYESETSDLHWLQQLS